jgi:hypothetical protein
MSESSNGKNLVQQARFVFKGTVQKLKASTMPEEIKATNRTAVVKVGQVIQASEALSDYLGQEVTVELIEGKKIEEGKEYIFYTDPTKFKDSLAVISYDQHPVEDAPPTLAAAMDNNPVKNLVSKDLQSRFEDADLVVSGKVVSIRVPEDTAVGMIGAEANAATDQQGPISEHDPAIQEAVIEIDEVHKGTHSKKNVVVRFPSSRDVRWYKVPKLQPGEAGYFMLHKGDTKEGSTRSKTMAATLLADSPDEAYAITGSLDFQPYDQASGIKNIIASDNKSGNT